MARQLGHDARLTLTRYGHVIDELEDRPRIEAEAAIADARLAVRTAGSGGHAGPRFVKGLSSTPVDELSGSVDRRLPPGSGLYLGRVDACTRQP